MKTWFFYSIDIFTEVSGVIPVDTLEMDFEPVFFTSSEALAFAKDEVQKYFIENPDCVYAEINIYAYDGEDNIHTGTYEVMPEVQEFKSADLLDKFGVSESLEKLKSLI